MSGSLTVLVSASLASLCVETLLYGCFLILFGLSLYLINAPSIRGDRCTYPKPMLCFSILIFFLVTACWILSVVQAFQAFASGRAAAEVFADQSQFSFVLREGVLMGLFVTSNLTIIYRLWLVWNHSRRVIILPIILLFVLGAFAVMKVYELASGKNIVQNEQVVIFGIGMSSLSIDVYSAGMIIYRLCQAGMITRDWENGSRFKFVIITLVESLSLYTIWGVLFTILFSFKFPVGRVFGDTQSTVIGIAFAILHVRVGMRRLGHDAATLVEGRPSQAKVYGEA